MYHAQYHHYTTLVYGIVTYRESAVTNVEAKCSIGICTECLAASDGLSLQYHLQVHSPEPSNRHGLSRHKVVQQIVQLLKEL